MKDRDCAAPLRNAGALRSMSEEPGRITRRFLTPPVHDVHAHLRARMEALGMTVRVDAAGNLRGLWQPAGASGKRLMLGSHIDTVPGCRRIRRRAGRDAGAWNWCRIAQEAALPSRHRSDCIL